jgi:hypothetical protein
VSNNILYISYDGLTDPLGQSQILPYILGLEEKGYVFTILTFEKPQRLLRLKLKIDNLIAGKKITWVPLKFTTNPPLLSKFYDAMRMKYAAVKLHKREKFSMVHCRSYIAADVGLHLKKKSGVKFLFDMRGFWADEKKDGGSWNIKNPIFKRIYSYYKTKERDYIQNADCIIVLTEAGKKEINKWPFYNPAIQLKVIPCCADIDLFSLKTEEEKKEGRRQLKLANDILLFSYLGSIGAWYMLDEMLQFFAQAKKSYPSAKFLFVTHTDPAVILTKANALGINGADVVIMEADRHEVPKLIKASDINISFIKPVYSKISSSPTKLGEVLSMGIPVVCNSGVGDVEAIVMTASAGFVIDEFTEVEYAKVIKNIPALLKKDALLIRNSIKGFYSLKTGIDLYSSCYKYVLIDEKKNISSLSLS